MSKKILKWFHHSERGFTLIELLVVVAILGILAAVAIPNVSKFIGTGRTQAMATEKKSVGNAVMAAMADTNTTTIAAALDFGNTGRDSTTPTGTDADVNGAGAGGSVGGFIMGGAGTVRGDYLIGTDGTVTQQWYP